jgi:hypothetical protein
MSLLLKLPELSSTIIRVKAERGDQRWDKDHVTEA